MAALDVDEPQCLVDFFEDPNGYRWHMRLLLIQGGSNSSRWIWATPDLEVQVGDLSDHRIVALSKGQPLPPDKIQETYGFDPLTPEALNQLR
eukprot:1734223-Amphidinium_carterae.1